MLKVECNATDGSRDGCESGAGLRPENGGEQGCAFRSVLVHRRFGQHEVLRGGARRAGERLRGGHGLRRQLHRGVLGGAGVGYAGLSRPLHLRDPALAPPGQRRGPHDLRHPHAGRGTLRGRFAPCAGARSASGRRGRLLVHRGARAGVLLLQGRRGHPGARPRQLFRSDVARFRLRLAPRHGAHPGEDGHSRGVLPP